MNSLQPLQINIEFNVITQFQVTNQPESDYLHKLNELEESKQRTLRVENWQLFLNFKTFSSQKNDVFSNTKYVLFHQFFSKNKYNFRALELYFMFFQISKWVPFRLLTTKKCRFWPAVQSYVCVPTKSLSIMHSQSCPNCVSMHFCCNKFVVRLCKERRISTRKPYNFELHFDH